MLFSFDSASFLMMEYVFAIVRGMVIYGPMRYEVLFYSILSATTTNDFLQTDIQFLCKHYLKSFDQTASSLF